MPILLVSGPFFLHPSFLNNLQRFKSSIHRHPRLPDSHPILEFFLIFFFSWSTPDLRVQHLLESISLTKKKKKCNDELSLFWSKNVCNPIQKTDYFLGFLSSEFTVITPRNYYLFIYLIIFWYFPALSWEKAQTNKEVFQEIVYLIQNYYYGGSTAKMAVTAQSLLPIHAKFADCTRSWKIVTFCSNFEFIIILVEVTF